MTAAPPTFVGRLQDRDLEALLRQIISAGQAIVAGTDDDRVVQIPPVVLSASGPALRTWSDGARRSRRKSAFFSRAFTAMAAACRISGASGPIM